VATLFVVGAEAVCNLRDGPKSEVTLNGHIFVVL